MTNPTRNTNAKALGITAAILTAACCTGIGFNAAFGGNDEPTAPSTTAPVQRLVDPAADPATAPTAEPVEQETDEPEPEPTTTRPKPNPAKTKPKPRPTTEEPEPEPEDVYYKNCTAVRDAGADPIHRGDPGYGKHLDRDGDGVGCE